MTDMNEELFPIVNERGETVGSAPRSVCHDGVSHLLHPVVHLHIVSRDGGRVLLQKRSMDKDVQPSKWDTSVGGHVDYGECVREALMRESREELGVDASSAEAVGRYVWTSPKEHELVNVNLLRVDEDDIKVNFDPVEIDEVRFWSLDELRFAVGRELLTPNFEKEFFERVLPLLE